jgi:hypothetical protein
MTTEEREPEGFVADHQVRKQATAQKRKTDRPPERDGGRKIHKVGATKERWKFNPKVVDWDPEDDYG